MSSSIVKLFLIVGYLSTLMLQQPSEALLLGNFIGCNSFGCRISALESDVAQLKLQVARMSDPSRIPGMNNNNNNIQPNQMLPFGQNGMNPQSGNQQGTNTNNNQQQQGQTDTGSRVNYALDYPVMNQNLRRTPGFNQNVMNNGQFLSI